MKSLQPLHVKFAVQRVRLFARSMAPSAVEATNYEAPRCSYVFVSDPWTDWAAIYNLDYYSGRGPDKLVDYCDELENVATVRRHEWEGILRWARALSAVDQSTTWLDYGCGSGGLVASCGITA